MASREPDIGELAGEIWRYLHRHGESSTLQLRAALKMSQSGLFLGLGWLAREGKVAIADHEAGFRVRLR
jgi:hypothetical protein